MLKKVDAIRILMEFLLVLVTILLTPDFFFYRNSWRILMTSFWWHTWTFQSSKQMPLEFLRNSFCNSWTTFSASKYKFFSKVSNNARNMCKLFSLVPSKRLVTRENWDKLSVYFFNRPKDQLCKIAKCQMAFFW